MFHSKKKDHQLIKKCYLTGILNKNIKINMFFLLTGDLFFQMKHCFES